MIISKKNILVRLFYACLVTVVIPEFLHAQNNKKVDSLVKSSALGIYTDPDQVIKNGELIIKEAGDDVEAKINGYLLVSGGYSVKRDYEKSLKYDIKAIDLMSLTDNELLKISVLTRTGIKYQQLKIYDKSLKYMDQAEQLILKYPIKDSVCVNLGKNYIVRGLIFKDRLDTGLAIEFFDRGIAELLKSNSKSINAPLSIAEYNKGYCYVSQLNYKSAFKSFSEANEHAKIIKAKTLQAFALKGMAEVFAFYGNYPLAIKTLEEALSYASGGYDLILNKEIYAGLANDFLALNNMAGFKVYYLKYVNTNKLIKHNERQSISDSLAAREKELKMKIEKGTTYFYLLISILFLVLVFTVLFFYIKFKKKFLNVSIKKNEVKSIFDKKNFITT